MGRKEIELEAERLLEPALKQLGIELIDVDSTLIHEITYISFFDQIGFIKILVQLYQFFIHDFQILLYH